MESEHDTPKRALRRLRGLLNSYYMVPGDKALAKLVFLRESAAWSSGPSLLPDLFFEPLLDGDWVSVSGRG